jgi:hypothetical protein
MEQSGRKSAQIAAKGEAAKAAQVLASRRLWLLPLATEPRW